MSADHHDPVEEGGGEADNGSRNEDVTAVKTAAEDEMKRVVSALLKAIESRDEDAAVALLSTISSIDHINKPGQGFLQSPLHLAAYCNRKNVIDKLLDRGVNPKLLDAGDDTAADLAVWMSHYKLADHLVKKGSTLKLNEENKKTIEHILDLMISIEEGDEDATLTMLQTKTPLWTADQLNIEVRTPPLHFAAQKDMPRVIEKLIAEYGVKPQLLDSSGDTAADDAIRLQKYKLAKHLVVMKGSTLNEENKKIENILELMISIEEGDEDATLTMLQTKPPLWTADQLNIEVGTPPLHFAAQKDMPRVIEKLIVEYGVNPQLLACHTINGHTIQRGTVRFQPTIAIQGGTAADEAIRFQKYKLAEFLLEKESKLTKRSNRYIETSLLPLMHCMEDKNEDTAITMLSSDPSKWTVDQLKKTVMWPPLHYAASQGLVKVVRKILQCGVDKDMLDENGYKALLRAVENNHPEVVEILLLEKNANDTFSTFPNISLLSHAAMYGYDEIMKKLINKGADITKMKANTPKIPSEVLKHCLDECISFSGMERNLEEKDNLSDEERKSKKKEMKREKKEEQKIIFNYQLLLGSDKNVNTRSSTVSSSSKVNYSKSQKASTEEDDNDSASQLIQENTPNDDVKIQVGEDEALNEKSKICETQLVKNFLDSSYPNEILPHPIIKTFLFAKWKKVEKMIWIWILIKLAFFVLLLNTPTIWPKTTSQSNKTNSTDVDDGYDIMGDFPANQTILINFESSSVEWNSFLNKTDSSLFLETTAQSKNQSGHIKTGNVIYLVLLVIFFLMYGITELIQIVNALRGYEGKEIPTYFKDFKNFIQWAIIICLTILIIMLSLSMKTSDIDELPTLYRQTLGVLLPLSCFELLHEIGHLPGFAHIIYIFEMVTGTFVSYLFFYSIMIISFAMSFFVMLPDSDNDADYPNGFGKLLVKFVVMFSGEQEFMNIPFSDTDNGFELLFFVIFILLITIILMNVLNALAIWDIQEMMKEAEVPMLNQLLDTVLLCDEIFLGYKFPKLTLFDKNMKTLSFYPFKDGTKLTLMQKIKELPPIKKIRKYFFYTSMVIDEECIHGLKGALQITKDLEIKKEEEAEKRREIANYLKIKAEEGTEKKNTKEKEEREEKRKKEEDEWRKKEKEKEEKIDKMLNILSQLKISVSPGEDHSSSSDEQNQTLPNIRKQKQILAMVETIIEEIHQNNPPQLEHLTQNEDHFKKNLKDCFLKQY